MPSNTEAELEFQDWKENLIRDIEQDVNTERAQGGPSLGGTYIFLSIVAYVLLSVRSQMPPPAE